MCDKLAYASPFSADHGLFSGSLADIARSNGVKKPLKGAGRAKANKGILSMSSLFEALEKSGGGSAANGGGSKAGGSRTVIDPAGIMGKVKGSLPKLDKKNSVGFGALCLANRLASRQTRHRRRRRTRRARGLRRSPRLSTETDSRDSACGSVATGAGRGTRSGTGGTKNKGH